MSGTGAGATPPGWYADPAGSDQLRWWDGSAWTANLAARPTPAPAPQPAQPAVEPAPYVPMTGGYAPMATVANTASPDRYGYGASRDHSFVPDSSNTVSAWIIALSPLLSAAVSIATVSLVIQNALSPGNEFVPLIVFGSVIAVDLILLGVAARDRSTLVRRGYSNPASFWWVLLFSPFLYLILRTVRVSREVRGGGAPLWASIGAWFGSIVMATIAVVLIVPTLVGATVGSGTTIASDIQTGMDSAGGNYAVTCPATVQLSIGSQIRCTVIDSTTQQSHSLLIDVVRGSDGKPTLALNSVTPPLP